jgi:hypothetical protein
LKKRTKKLLFSPQLRLVGHGQPGAAPQEIKVFWFFSSEKNILDFSDFS